MILPIIFGTVGVARAEGPDLARPGHTRARSVDVFSPRRGDLPPAPGTDASQLPAPLSDTFRLHSNPDATKIIYLDFDGHTVNWGSSSFEYGPWNRQGSPATYSDEERTIIQLAWRSIAEDFLPFDIDVTTEEPPLEHLINSGGSDTRWGVRAVINHYTYGYSWAYTGSFSDAEDTELFAWGSNKTSVYETWVWLADSVSHEAGHALGLSHDGTTRGVEYYPGHGEGIHDWSPIMGWAGYGLSQWSIGEYTDANNRQDDLAIITSQNGFGYRADDHGSSPDTATPLDVTSEVPLTGIIETTDDIDVFSFALEQPGRLVLAVRPDSLAPNLDIGATLRAEDGTALATSAPADTLSAHFEEALPAGRYTLSVDGVGYDDPKSDGYSDYGSLGYFQIEATFEAETPSDTGITDDTGATDDTGPAGDTGAPTDTGEPPDLDSGAPPESQAPPEGGCSCAVHQRPGALAATLALLLPALVVRRRG